MARGLGTAKIVNMMRQEGASRPGEVICLGSVQLQHCRHTLQNKSTLQMLRRKPCGCKLAERVSLWQQLQHPEVLN